MAHNVVFRPAAADDLDQIDDFIALDGPQRVIAFVHWIRERCEELADMPSRGPRREDLGPVAGGALRSSGP